MSKRREYRDSRDRDEDLNYASDAFDRATLYVEGVPTDANEREVAHIFRPFIGFRDVRLVRRDSKRNPGTQFIICFAEFEQKLQADYCLSILQGYTFSKSDPPEKGLRLQHAKNDNYERRRRDSYSPNPRRSRD
eukprot:NODE_6630_length_515_cov_100.881443_g6464_i0.p1 GENE.NODE_6630_length_515_cov_100.881443_g6464_i0~~NODE_6630_length_515_cov_100.881443_g6464_i0.p1  ORF type:complete len:134 (+),score=15.94 NODE_6630_length_515_cov_100.881443_g6464_i0:58-459(+)